ncbi:hypothetical protein [Kitasatospora aureofaciens]|uniref:hypothetical protein n=1 Tax=Kitasatospora aureofaciens TaxID=1894 RepID=UPI001C488952|nr:hypothetical protein [Kitasatospora aureofaciens]MBV6699973.1 hypothetical protein [Kitasatospora aureofaciens]
MRATPHLRTGEGMAALTAAVVAATSIAAIGLSPAGARPVVGAALGGAAAAVLGLLVVAAFARRARSRRHSQQLDRNTAEAWFTTADIGDFPEEALRPLLPATDPPSMNRLYTAWVFATHGHEAVWLERHLGLTGDLARKLVEQAHRRSGLPHS